MIYSRVFGCDSDQFRDQIMIVDRATRPDRDHDHGCYHIDIYIDIYLVFVLYEVLGSIMN